MNSMNNQLIISCIHLHKDVNSWLKHFVSRSRTYCQTTIVPFIRILVINKVNSRRTRSYFQYSLVCLASWKFQLFLEIVINAVFWILQLFLVFHCLETITRACYLSWKYDFNPFHSLNKLLLSFFSPFTSWRTLKIHQIQCSVAYR